jgi:glycosyltransferase involved in cell wall biosynthesis
MRKKVDICIPVYNEELIIAETIGALKTFSGNQEIYDFQFIFLDNASTDSTAKVITESMFDQCRLVTISERGKGRAVRYAAQYSDAEYYGFIDADLSAKPDELLSLLRLLDTSDAAHIVVGSRFLSPSMVNRSFWRSLTSTLFNQYAQLMIPVPVRDTQCGIKVMTNKGKKALLDCQENGWFFDREFLGIAHVKGLLIKEHPVQWEEFHFKQRKSKLNPVIDGIKSAWILYDIRRRIKNHHEKRSV